jgi:hypothetical protein
VPPGFRPRNPDDSKNPAGRFGYTARARAAVLVLVPVPDAAAAVVVEAAAATMATAVMASHPG